jgi:cyclopropane-fatty-acyl-phospholipid synthase
MIDSLIAKSLQKLVRTGTLDVTFASGRTRSFGDRSEAPIRIRFADPAAERALVLDPALKLGELFMDGRLIVEEGTVYDLVSLIKRNGLRRLRAPHVALLALWRVARGRIARAITPDSARRNVAHHYDLFRNPGSKP